MKLGAHIGIGRGLSGAADEAKLLGCEALQVFMSNPRGWDFKVRPESEIRSFRSKIKKYKIDYVFGHSIYLTNIASSNPYIYTNSINSLISSAVMADRAGFSGIVTHLGSHAGKGYQSGLKQILNALEQIINTTKGKVPILLENDAGSGNHIGRVFSEIGDVTKKLKSQSIKVCFDTCHSFVSGYELRTRDGLEKTLAEFDKEIGLEKMALVHLNDSKGELGSNLDRHEVIGEGTLGIKSFEMIVNHPKLKHLPGIVETPDIKTPAGENISLKRLKKIRKSD